MGPAPSRQSNSGGTQGVPHLGDPLWASEFMAMLFPVTSAFQRTQGLLLAGANRASRFLPGGRDGISC